MTIIDIEFEIISATCRQECEIVDDTYTVETIVEGLNNGTLITTTWHDGKVTHATIDELRTGKEVAIIHSQEIEGEYEDFANGN